MGGQKQRVRKVRKGEKERKGVSRNGGGGGLGGAEVGSISQSIGIESGSFHVRPWGSGGGGVREEEGDRDRDRERKRGLDSVR